jgi:hypothetical protein
MTEEGLNFVSCTLFKEHKTITLVLKESTP